MQAKTMVVIMASLLTGVASYAEPGLTREQVRAELARAMAAGELAAINEGWDGSFAAPRPAGVHGRAFVEKGATREQVRAELTSGGKLAPTNEGWDGSLYSEQPAAAGVRGRAFAEPPGLTRAEVMAEYQRALRSGEIARHRFGDGVGGN